ncbi:asparagine synthase (glutamine-hydrolyzing) [Falsiroseomonas sp.]|uniref:asparagine synthase (glutamine-hydrolyzing) n=1 Tax=Falsiroseomonas sp. TaxID=2870721 RepID=UPI00356304B2
MCGIIGLVGEACGIGAERLARARDLMLHRGPDQTGLRELEEACLGFRRLAILDLSAAGHQPMLSADGQVALVFNGEIYNFQELRRELELHFPFRSQSDSEVLLNGYLAWGWEELLRRADGMFAFAIWDARRRSFFAARDRVGKKPLFYAETPGGLAFASTLNALSALLPDRRAVDPAALDAYLTYQAVPAPLTIFQGMRQLPPAHQLSCDLGTGEVKVARYWDLPFTPKIRASEAEVLDELDALLRGAVRRRLMSDVPLGAFLSGGVDSSLVTAIMAQEGAGPVQAVVVGFDDPAFDERPHARKVAQRWGAELHEHLLQPDATRDLPEIVWHYGQPLADVSIVPTWYVAKAARQHVTVVLNGDGGDEVFGGYARPMVARAAQHYRRLLPRKLRQALARATHSLDRPGLPRKLRMLAEAGAVTAEQAFTYDRAFRPHRAEAYAPALRAALAGEHPDALYRAAWDRADGADDVDRALYGDFVTYLPDQLLAKMDVSTMAHSVEARSPLLDRQLVEYAARIPTSLRLKGYTTKYLLKRLAERYVPRKVLYRRKQGFVMPAGQWLRGELAPHAEAALLGRPFAERGWMDPDFTRRMLREHQSGVRDWGQPLWTLFVLEIWARQALDGTLSRSDGLEALR